MNDTVSAIELMDSGINLPRRRFVLGFAGCSLMAGVGLTPSLVSA